MTRSAEDTRISLIDAAKSLYHRQGFQRTTLADVAASAQVPLGSVYYYFRSKEALAQAVIHAHAEDIRRFLHGFDELPQPRQRIKALLASSAHNAGIFSRYGCPYGTLAVELDKGEDSLVAPVGSLLALYVDWIAQQYEQMGAGDQARALAVNLVAAMQGAYLLSNAFRDAELLKNEMARLTLAVDLWVIA